MKKRRLMLTLLPTVWGLVTRLICLHIDAGVARLNAPPGMPRLWLLWLCWTAVLLALGLTLSFTLYSGDSRRYKAVKLLMCALALYNLWPLLMAGRLWMTPSGLLGAAVTVLSAVCTVRFFRIDRKAGWCSAVFTAWTVYELYLTWGYSVLN